MPGENRTLTPVWIAYVDGVRLGTGYEGALRRIYIHDRLDFAGTASLLFGSSPLDFFNDGTFTIGSEVSIHLGYKDLRPPPDGGKNAFKAPQAKQGNKMRIV